MVAADHDFIGQVLHQPPAPHLDLRAASVRGLGELAELAAEILPDRLHAEADAEDRQLFLQRRANRFGDAETFRPAGTLRPDPNVALSLLEHFNGVHVPDT